MAPLPGPQASTQCPCCSGKSYAACCKPLLETELDAANPEQCMRARYTAFCLGNVTYLTTTSAAYEGLDPKQQNHHEQQLKNTLQTTQWLGLKVLQSEYNEVSGEVEFVAFFRGDKGVDQLHERSRFSFSQRWLYAQGTQLPDIKVGRNEPCYCGSGVKFKKCCTLLPGDEPHQ